MIDLLFLFNCFTLYSNNLNTLYQLTTIVCEVKLPEVIKYVSNNQAPKLLHFQNIYAFLHHYFPLVPCCILSITLMI